MLYRYMYYGSAARDRSVEIIINFEFGHRNYADTLQGTYMYVHLYLHGGTTTMRMYVCIYWHIDSLIDAWPGRLIPTSV